MQVRCFSWTRRHGERFVALHRERALETPFFHHHKRNSQRMLERKESVGSSQDRRRLSLSRLFPSKGDERGAGFGPRPRRPSCGSPRPRTQTGTCAAIEHGLSPVVRSSKTDRALSAPNFDRWCVAISVRTSVQFSKGEDVFWERRCTFSIPARDPLRVTMFLRVRR